VQSIGFSATWQGMPVSLVRKRSKLRSSELPPVITMPRSIMSEASSGGVRSSTVFTFSAMVPRLSPSASVTSCEVRVMMRGRPATWSRPRTSMVSGSSSFMALPMVILTSSAVASPMTRLYLRRT